MAPGASTSAGKRRSAAKSATRRGHAAPKRGATRTKSPAKRPATRAKPGTKRASKRPATRRSPTRRSKPRLLSLSPRTRPKRAAASKTTPRRARSGRLLSRARISLRAGLITAAIVLAGLTTAYFGWFRDSSLVAVEQVKVEGATSPQAGQIVAALTEEAKTMSTLHLSEADLARAVEDFPTVVSVSADAHLPHGVAISVTERPPVLLVTTGSETVPVAGDGTLLQGVDVGDLPIPKIEVKELPASGRLEGEPLAEAAVVGATPAALRPLITAVAVDGENGVVVTLEGGIPVRFGTAERAGAKWAAAAAVLADPKLETLTYVDVRVPERPAAGGAAAPAAEEAPAEPVAPVATEPDPAL